MIQLPDDIIAGIIVELEMRQDELRERTSVFAKIPLSEVEKISSEGHLKVCNLILNFLNKEIGWREAKCK